MVEKEEKKGAKSDEETAALAAADLETLTISNAEEIIEDDDDDKDPDLFKPPPPREDCPICMLPLPFEYRTLAYRVCCGAVLCAACFEESKRVIEKTNVKKRKKKLPLLEFCCPFCREPMDESHEKAIIRLRKRIELNDVVAHHCLAQSYLGGSDGFPKDQRKAFELFLRATELGSLHAPVIVAECFGEGRGVNMDAAKEKHYLKVAAKRGDMLGRHCLGMVEWNGGNKSLAMKHWLISAAAGHDESLRQIKEGFMNGFVNRDEYAYALRTHQKVRDDAQSEERDRYAAIHLSG